MKEIKTVSLIGLGAVGSYFASKLQPVLGDGLRVVADGERKKRIEAEGLMINGTRYDFRVTEPGDVTGYADLAIIIPKFMGLRRALEDMKNQIGPETLILAPLNGVETEAVVAEYYPEESILPSLMMIGSVRKGNACVFDADHSALQMGEWTNDPVSERAAMVRDFLKNAGLKVQVPADMKRAKWLKFMINVSENQSSAVLGLSYGAWNGENESATAVREQLAREVIALANAQGIDLSEEDLVTRRKRIAAVDPANKTSMLQDMEAGRPTEVEIFAGTMMRLGKRYGVDTPCNELIYHMIKALEQKNR
ncbi:MAG: 2-dehydropantoate 2-reductase [Clostridiales bacterium]|nr:2-dehydropantoate 2-reductase [Clostridiales bacterium]